VRRSFTIAVTALLLSVLGIATASAQDSAEGVQGSITTQEDEPVPEVVIVIETADGDEVAEAVTEPDGSFQAPVPGPGDYQATLLADTLPEGLELRNPDRATLEFPVSSGQTRTLLFPLSDGEALVGGATLWRTALQLFVEGLKFGLIIAMSAIGLSLIFGTTGLVNFAHGELVTLGALVVWGLNQALGIHLIPAVLIGVVLGALAGAGQDRALWRPLRDRGTGLIAMLVISIGLSIFARYVFLYIFEGRARPYAQYAVQSAWNLGPVRITPKDLTVMLLSVLVLVSVGLLLQKTKIGRAMRAVAGNRDLAASSGIDVEKVIMYVWALGGALATMGGVAFGLAESVRWEMGFTLLLLMFAGVVLGGLGTAYGALVGSMIVGIFVQMSTLVVSPELKNVGALLVMIIILLVRPQGILGKKQRVG
jgi:branched-subunit amino acid ABC-type transport system permease component